MKRWTLIALITAACLSFTTQTHAQPRIGDTMPSFELQATDGKFYGSKNASGKVSVYFFVGYN
jgi:cytochrome oxidase Cu insertion factor (SCO1/SenC/PrrC family)